MLEIELNNGLNYFVFCMKLDDVEVFSKINQKITITKYFIHEIPV